MPDYGGPTGFGSDDSVSGTSGGTPGLSGSRDVVSGFALGPTDTGPKGSDDLSPMDRAALTAARAALAAGFNPFATSTKMGLAQGLGKQGFFGEGFGDNQDVGKPEGILGVLGYDTRKGFFDNLIDMVVPGRNTPLGAFSALVPGLTEAQQIALGVANAIIGRDMNKGRTPSETALSDSVVGRDSIVGALADMPQTGIASGKQTTTTGYTGRPDDAPAPAAPASAKGNLNALEQQAIDAVNDMINQQTKNNLSTGKPTTVGPEAFGVKARQVGTLEDMQRGLQQLADNIVSIPGGYLDTKTGLTYSGDYQKNAPARTVTGKQTQGVTPFSLEALQQNLFGS